MKTAKAFIVLLIVSITFMGCGGASSETQDASGDQSEQLSSQDQAEIVATALMTDTGGIGKDIVNMVAPATPSTARSANVSLTVSAERNYYDAEDNQQDRYDSETTDRIDYESLVQGHLSATIGFFDELDIDNQADFMATELLSGTAVIDGTHSNHSSYNRTQWLTGAEIEYRLDCDLSAVGVAIDLDAADRVPEAGTIEGTISGFWERTSDFSTVTKTLNFHFIAIYLGDNTAEIELNDGSLFTIDLGRGDLVRVE